MRETVLAVLAILMLCSCSNYNFSQAVYEGVQTHNQLNTTPGERLNTPQMNYDQYETERKH